MLGPGDIYTTHTPTYVEAVADSLLYVIDTAAFTRMLASDPAITPVLMRVLGRLLANAVNLIEDLADCAGNARRLMQYIEDNMAASGNAEPFWQDFMGQRQPRSVPAPDDLFLVHAHINQIREFIEVCGEEAALALLLQVEEECCLGMPAMTFLIQPVF